MLAGDRDVLLPRVLHSGHPFGGIEPHRVEPLQQRLVSGRRHQKGGCRARDWGAQTLEGPDRLS